MQELELLELGAYVLYVHEGLCPRTPLRCINSLYPTPLWTLQRALALHVLSIPAYFKGYIVSSGCVGIDMIVKVALNIYLEFKVALNMYLEFKLVPVVDMVFKVDTLYQNGRYNI